VKVRDDVLYPSTVGVLARPDSVPVLSVFEQVQVMVARGFPPITVHLIVCCFPENMSEGKSVMDGGVFDGRPGEEREHMHGL